MIIKINKINNRLLTLIFSLIFLGFYIIVLILISAGLTNFSRTITIPVRLFISFCLFMLCMINIRKVKIYKETLLFLLFSFFFLLRILLDFNNQSSYFLGLSNVFLYFISFSVLPFLLLSTYKFTEENFKKIITSIIYTGLVFSVLVLYFYGKYIGTVTRISGSYTEESVISPLLLSYCSILIIGALSTYLMFNKVTVREKLIAVFAIILSVIPFFLGASRGSLISLILPILIFSFYRYNYKKFFRYILITIFFILGLTFFAEKLGSGLVDRFLDISENINNNSEEALRLKIWKSSFNQFINSPIIGDKLTVDGWETYYPHNIFIETLQATGILGFLPLLLLMYKGFKYSIFIFKKFPEYAWIPIIFLQSFFKNMFSGAVYSASWLWASLALLIAVKYFLKKQYKLE